MNFRWSARNIEHIGNHGVSWEEAEIVVRGARSPFPRRIENDKWLVWGHGQGGRFLQVIFILDPDDCVYVIHARPLTEQEKRRLRRRKGR